jgi:hypothetical protein
MMRVVPWSRGRRKLLTNSGYHAPRVLNTQILAVPVDLPHNNDNVAATLREELSMLKVVRGKGFY